MFSKVLAANRGEIALRIMRSAKELGCGTVAVYSTADCHSAHMIQADEAHCIGPGPASDSYLCISKIIDAAKTSGVEAIHPGYGFLSENAEFAEACENAGITFVGPTPENIRQFGLKHTARELAQESDVPLLPGTDLLDGVDDAVKQAECIGYPIMLKSTAGGGGIGMSVCSNKAELIDAYQRIERLSKNNFKHSGIFAEKYVERCRHIEVQIFGDGKGNAIALGERDCSTQRRNQKVIEETPAPRITENTRASLLEASVRLAKTGNYQSAGTVEYIYDENDNAFYFLEVNTRLQVEHCVTEEVTGVDLVAWMLQLAAGELPDLNTLAVQPSGCAMQVRVYAEDPARDFQPSPGILTQVNFPSNVRVDTWITQGSDVPPYYDPLLAKIIAKADSREDVIMRMREALDNTVMHGIQTNASYLREVLDIEDFYSGNVHVKLLDDFAYSPNAIEVIRAGTQTSIQDYPGRLGYWVVGVPPSGPMDTLNFRLANRILGNDSGAAALECTVNGPVLRFHSDTTISVTGADMNPAIDGQEIALYEPVHVKAGSKLRMGIAKSTGQRSYIAVAGGFDVPEYLGSKSTFMLGQFGGHGGRSLRPGDMLNLNTSADMELRPIPEDMRPALTHNWEVGVLYGPHGSPDFFTDKDIETFFLSNWKVHFNSDRTGIRLIGPKPEWARSDGGEAGLHPSNIHDNAYAIGTIDFTGDMPIILGPDGPSLGGFVCPATIVEAEKWKMGQLKPGDTVRFIRWSQAEAVQAESKQISYIEHPGTYELIQATDEGKDHPAVLLTLHEESEKERIVVRRSGDKYVLIEFGPLELDLSLRFKAHAFMEYFEKLKLKCLIDLTPGIRSLQIHYDSLALPLDKLIELIQKADAVMPPLEDLTVPSRIVHLPLSWDDPVTHEAIQKYMQSVRQDAPWCPSNIEFIRRINGLDSIEDVKRILFEANYLVMGLGDVYLGAPVATPVDPRHRLVTTKYNPARTWTAENSVGIGGAYLCVYGMEGPGGYQFVGRTLQMWNRYNQTADFTDSKPWLLRFFDQLKFYPVSHEELQVLRQEFVNGAFKLSIEETNLNLGTYQKFLSDNKDDIRSFKSSQQEAFNAERARWEASGQVTYEPADDVQKENEEIPVPDGSEGAMSPVAGCVWKINVTCGQQVKEDECLIVVESMKLEIQVVADCDGVVDSIHCDVGASVHSGQILAILTPEKP